VAGVRVLYEARQRLVHREHGRDEHARAVAIAVQQRVDPAERGRGRERPRQLGEQRHAERRHHHRRAHAMAGDVGDHQAEVAAAERHHVVVVAADVARGSEARGELQALDRGDRRGQQRVLHHARGLELVTERRDLAAAARRGRGRRALHRQRDEIGEPVAQRATVGRAAAGAPEEVADAPALVIAHGNQVRLAAEGTLAAAAQRAPLVLERGRTRGLRGLRREDRAALGIEDEAARADRARDRAEQRAEPFHVHGAPTITGRSGAGGAPLARPDAPRRAGGRARG